MSAQFTFGTYTKAEKVNPYTDVVKQMIYTGNPDTSVTFSVPNENVIREETTFRKAANAANRTAKFVSREDGKNETTFTVVLTKRHKPRRGVKVDS